MGCGLAKEYRIINLYDLADIKLKNTPLLCNNVMITSSCGLVHKSSYYVVVVV